MCTYIRFRRGVVQFRSLTTYDREIISGLDVNADDIGENEFKRKRQLKEEKRQRSDIFKKTNMIPARSGKMSVNQDWPSVWPAPASFKASVVPLPLRQGLPYLPKWPSPRAYGNFELMKISNFLHLTPQAIKRHCEAIIKFCTPWPSQLTSKYRFKGLIPHYNYGSYKIFEFRSVKNLLPPGISNPCDVFLSPPGRQISSINILPDASSSTIPTISSPNYFEQYKGKFVEVFGQDLVDQAQIKTEHSGDGGPNSSFDNNPTKEFLDYQETLLKHYYQAYEHEEKIVLGNKIARHFPVEVITTDYCFSAPSIRDDRARRVTLRLKVEALRLDYRATDKLLRLTTEKYNPETGYITLTTDRCPTRKQNYDYLIYILTALYHESINLESWEDGKEIRDLELYFWNKMKSSDAVYETIKSRIKFKKASFVVYDNAQTDAKSDMNPSDSREKESAPDYLDRIESSMSGRMEDFDKELLISAKIPEIVEYANCVTKYHESPIEDPFLLQNEYKNAALKLLGLPKFDI